MMIGGRVVDSIFDTMMTILPPIEDTGNLSTFDLLDREHLMDPSEEQNWALHIASLTADTVFEDFENNKRSVWIMNEDSDDGGRLLNHDCMWTGHCGSTEHAEEPPSNLTPLLPKPPVIRDVMLCPPLVMPKQESLLKPSVKAQSFVAAPLLNGEKQGTPQTPPESDDEESSVLNLLKDAINECNSDLTDYFEAKEVKEEVIDIKYESLYECRFQQVVAQVQEETNTNNEIHRIRNQRAAANDHSYHKAMTAIKHISNYGLETPSDSEEEEEIDVVSVNEKAYSNANRTSLPTNPSRKDRHQWQRTVATAISKNGVKTILPVKSAAKPISNPTPTTGRRGGRKAADPPAEASAKPKAKPKPRANARSKAKSTAKATGGTKRKRKNGQALGPEDKRSLHNDMERQRRVDMRFAFQDLLFEIPDLCHAKRAAKVRILNQARQDTLNLCSKGNAIEKLRDELKQRRRELKHRHNLLVRSLIPLHPDPSLFPPKRPRPPRTKRVVFVEDTAEDSAEDTSDDDV